MARKSSDLGRIQAYLSETDAAWWSDMCGPEPDKLFRDQSALADVLLPVHWVYVDRLRAAGKKPMVPAGEWFVRIALSMRREHFDRVHGLSEGMFGFYASKSAFLADLTETGRRLMPELLDVVRAVGERRARAALATA